MHRINVWQCLILAVACTASLSAADALSGGGLPPWRFEMTKDDVRSFAEFGPYESFSNGDLETHAGLYEGRKENVQFFFEDGKLARIGILLYEGDSLDAAADTWVKAYEMLDARYGDIDLPKMHFEGWPREKRLPVLLNAAARSRVEVFGRARMAPLKQPSDKFVYASFNKAVFHGATVYTVVVFLDPPKP
ncbi:MULTISPECIES: hypothetical protein [Dyella]|uniref:Uncharacterized protein n=2 Tax=Dyella TaxID=231454 RepID=A0A4R0YDH3_9GAMM|nr:MULTISPECIES: hypothetical protein [Dyella]TBR36298.1 hypothetical protein EYV96_17095 [Dyella terrae]TCI05955.1 hypothetical protein EZM97_36185 [Dyella soli]